LFPRKCTYAKVIVIWFCEALVSLEIDIAYPPPNYPVSATARDLYSRCAAHTQSNC